MDKQKRGISMEVAKIAILAAILGWLIYIAFKR